MNIFYLGLLLLGLHGCGYYTWLKTGADAISFGNTGKTLTDHAISEYMGKDCRTFNILEEKQLCEEINDGV